ncbi:hypothetical protein ACXIUT_05970 [Achromobacter denitrificans]
MTTHSIVIAGIAAALAMSGATAFAADQIVGASLKPLPLYTQPGGGTPAAKANVQDLPWIVLEAREDFYRVKVGGTDYWVDSMHVQISRNSSARCGPVIKGVPPPTGSTAGAGEDACR